ncbi:MAG TPA: ABC transporter substrate-binding protein [Stellaceae bacterium]|nr:ABC transporter substrate-binding protein [Stellaceae bacterium]
MRRPLRLIAVLIGGIAFAAVSAPFAAAADPVKIGFNIWVGYGPLYIARDRGFFQKRGIDVDLIIIEEVREKLGDLAAGKLDMVASGGGTSLIYLTEPDQLQYVAALDDSNGADGVIAKNEITSLADLKGKRIALERGGVAQLYLATLLNSAGLKESDVILSTCGAMSSARPSSTVWSTPPSHGSRGFPGPRRPISVTCSPTPR